MAFTKTKTWADAETITHTDLNSIGSDVETYVNAGIPVADLAAPYAIQAITYHVETLSGGTTRNLYFKVPPNRTYIPISLQLVYDRDAALTPTITLDCQEGGVSILSAVLSTTTPDTVTETTSFADASLAGGATIKFVLTETIGAGNDAGNVCVNLFAKVQHAS